MRIPAVFATLLVLLFLLIFSSTDRDQFATLNSDIVVSLVASPASPQNTSLDVKYVGTEACIDCHKDNYASYLRTTHSQAAQETDANTEPAVGTFRNAYSGFDYEAVHRDGRLLHREIRKGSDGLTLGTTEAPIKYSIGSGTHGKSYVFQQDSFWYQSPISWYQKTKEWTMSPGYDKPFHLAFSRKLDNRCFFCHVGSVDLKDGNPFQFDVKEVTIGCERCHGPGELHLKKHPLSVKAEGSDHSIVNPARLVRELSEAICQQCHLMGLADAIPSGKSEWDFRPGLPMTDFRIDYQQRLTNDSMKIVGHVQQLHASECYKQTATLTCITCHDPHHTPTTESKTDFYRSVCLKCHADQSCGKPHDERVKRVGNDCATCHMPAASTNVPHTAFRHHRIGIHLPPDSAKPDNAKTDVVGELVPILDTVGMSPAERERHGALAKIQVLRDNGANPIFAPFANEAIAALIGLKQSGKDDAATNAALASLARDQGQTAIAIQLATEVREKERSPTSSRIDATRLLAQLAFNRSEFKQAVELYRELTTLTGDPLDIYNLGLCEQNVGDSESAIKALKKSIELDPSQEAAHVALQAIYQSTGRPAEAELHRQAASENQLIFNQLSQAAASINEPR